MLKNIETLWLTELNLIQFNDVKMLLNICEKYDGGGPIIYPNSLVQTRLPAMNGLIYYQHRLIAFVSTYFFYKTACECSLFVSPEYRKRGIAKILLQPLISLLKSQNMESIYFSASQSFSVENYPQLHFHSCEYRLTRPIDKSIKKSTARLHFRTAAFDDIESLCNLDHACFHNYDIDTMALRFQELIQSPYYHVLIGEKEGKLIAKAHIQWQQDQAIFSDIAVFPEYQRHGYGSEIVHACLIESQHRAFKQAMLEVESNNENALKLYLKHGFKVEKATNFWALNI
ncbi:GNAT family N-acetyltransferase [Legionella sp. W05-934-2]|jgi:ribosomal protein S18 acetylase RimI-like enzyme|uniref:GNAT family N-acetyltransferase n=1 Tax=Legionella sp. W05-934-2 TaxID=1198649 RepID=UPI00346200D3